MDNLNQSALDGLLPTPAELIPPELVTTIIVGFVALNVLGLAFLVLYIINLVRKWKVETAVFHMQKDLAEIKAALTKQTEPKPQPNVPPAASIEPIPPTPAETEPATSNEHPPQQ